MEGEQRISLFQQPAVRLVIRNSVDGFNGRRDKIAFSDAGFNLGLSSAGPRPRPLPASLISPKTNGAFINTTERFSYDAATGALYYDAHGDAARSSRHLVAVLSGHPILGGVDLFFAFLSPDRLEEPPVMRLWECPLRGAP